MNFLKMLLTVLFIARTTIPLGVKVEYKNVVKWDLIKGGQAYLLVLSDGRSVAVPSMWTIIEEQK